MIKIRVLIVEDEPPTARFIKALTEKEEGFEVLEMCESAEDALSFFESGGGAEAVVSDIRMARMDGLSLLCSLREEKPELSFIIISGYRMFEYAKEAIRLNVEEFITKPIDQQEFAAALSRIRTRFLEERGQKLEKAFERALGAKDEAVLEELMGTKEYALTMVFVGRSAETIKAMLRKTGVGITASFNEALLFFYEEESGGAGICRRALMKEGGGTWTLAERKDFLFGKECIGKLRDMYLLVLQNSIPGKFKTIPYTDCKDMKRSFVPRKTGVPETIRMNLSAGNVREAGKCVRSLKEEWRRREASVYEIREEIKELGDLLGEREAFLKLLDSFSGYEDLGEKVAALAETLLPREERGKKKEEELFAKITAMIARKMDQTYSLAEISRLFGISQPYVRKIFRKHTQSSYNEYLQNAKICYARELLEANPAMLIKDAADAVGMDPFYFSTIFSKKTGMTPSQYKEQAHKRK